MEKDRQVNSLNYDTSKSIFIMNNFSKYLSRTIATVFFVGYIPFASGTFGTLAGLGVVWLLSLDNFRIVVIAGVGMLIGTGSSHVAEKDFHEKDSKYIVIDEFVGYFISIAFLPLTAGYMVTAFFLFRFFDIWKPFPIRNIEKTVNGGLGVMLDDVAAGIFTNLILQIVSRTI